MPSSLPMLHVALSRSPRASLLKNHRSSSPLKLLQQVALLLTHVYLNCMIVVGKSCASADETVMRMDQLHCNPLSVWPNRRAILLPMERSPFDPYPGAGLSSPRCGVPVERISTEIPRLDPIPIRSRTSGSICLHLGSNPEKRELMVPTS